MISLTFNVSNIEDILYFYDSIIIEKYVGTNTSPTFPVDINEFSTISGGIDMTNSISNTTTVALTSANDNYVFYDPNGSSTDWYTSSYYSSSTGSYSGWAEPILGESNETYYNPLYPAEMTFSTADELILSRLRILIGDPVHIRRDFGPSAAAAIHPDLKTYELHEKGWPASIRFSTKQYTNAANPTVNGYKYLKFPTTISGAVTGSLNDLDIDIWYYTFRYSDRELIDAYDNCPVPTGLTTTTATAETYLLQTAIDLITQNIFEETFEDGAKIVDGDTSYDPTPGLNNLDKLLAKLQNRLDSLVDRLRMTGVTGVRLD